MRAILVSVGYTDLLRITLPYNRQHFDDVLVVTSPADAPNVEPLADESRARLFVTDAFYRDGADFNKWLALEEGLDFYGREGWLCLMDADVLWPRGLSVEPTADGARMFDTVSARLKRQRVPGYLYTPLRRICPLPLRLRPDPDCPVCYGRGWNGTDGPLGAWQTCPLTCSGLRPPPEKEWCQYPLHRNAAEWAGYSQIFHASDPVLGPPPWHDVTWRHAGGADSFFQEKWPASRKVRPPFEVLHLGEAGVNWCGRAGPLADGSLPEGAVEKRAKLSRYWRRRLGKTGPDRFRHEKL
jgi:hypothetical protein